VNNLREAVKLLALIHPEKDFSGVALDSTVANAARVHLLLRQYGFRWVPNYEKSEGSTQSRTTPTIYAERLLPRLLEIKPRDLLVLEQTLLAAKLEKLGDWICRGTLIFTYYVTGIVDELVAKTESCKLKAEVFTGESKKKNLDSFIERYKRKEVDVLIGSAPIGTGVDGLQHYLNRLLFITLPWSNAEYQQIVGRLYRQGRGARPVEIIIPQVTVREERAGIWSWDDLRLKLIEHKRTLADAAVDGMIPTDGLPSRKEMQRRSLKALQDWMGHVRKGIEPTQTAESAESKEQLKG
jgi:superfamily II DNA or RNA helicase